MNVRDESDGLFIEVQARPRASRSTGDAESVARPGAAGSGIAAAAKGRALWNEERGVSAESRLERKINYL